MVSQILLIVVTRFMLSAGECDGIFFTQENNLCYGMSMDETTDNCIAIPNTGYVQAMAINPVTDEFYIVSIPPGETPRIGDPNADHPRTLKKFVGGVDMNGTVSVSTPEDINTVAAGIPEDKLAALAFTCQGVPRLFGLSDYQAAYDNSIPQYLYEINVDTGALTQITSWSPVSEIDGNGLFYNIETELLYRIGEAIPITQSTIDPTDNTVTNDVLQYTLDGTLNFGATMFASYFNESYFITSDQFGEVMYLASITDAAFYNTGYFDGRTTISTGNNINSVQCDDFVERCQATFSLTPSEVPSSMPSSIPSSIPSNMPSSMPSSMPSNMPSRIPSSMPTGVLDLPETTGADSAQRNDIGFFVCFIAFIAYLFY